jgi:plasmid stability protein
MPQLTIRNISPETVEKLKARAKESGRSLESELRASRVNPRAEEM